MLSNDEIEKIVDDHTTDDHGYDIWCDGRGVARAIEAKVRQQDEALLRQCLDYLENHNPFSIGMYGRNLVHAIKARLGEA